MASPMDSSTDRRLRVPTGLGSSLAVLLATTALAGPVFAQDQAAPAAPQSQPAAPPAASPPAATAAAPQQPAAPAAPQEGVVQRIVIQGNERIENETILAYLSIQVGDT